MISTYRTQSSFDMLDLQSELQLQTALGATPEGYVVNPQFFTGFLARPEVASAALLTIADIAAARYIDLSVDRPRSLDPVVTASGDRLRFESFSADNGVYARLDLLSDGIDSGDIGFGTTNIDINPPLRTSLSGVGRGQLVHVAVGADALTLSTLDEHHVEREVAMPDRWIRGFAEAPRISAQMTGRGSIPGAGIALFLSRLSRGTPGPTIDLVVGPSGLRQTARAVSGSVRLAGTARLSAAARIARYASQLTVYSGTDGSSGWVFQLPGARLTLVLSPDPYRGFSGEGGLLGDLAQSTRDQSAALIAEQLTWEPTIDPGELARATGLSAAEVRGGISVLAASGKVGFDLSEQAWFHRELPLDPTRALRDNPRVVAGRDLAEAGHVERTGETWTVWSENHYQYVDRTPRGLRCSCRWWATYDGRRGPCKHALAVEIFESA